VRRFNRYPFSVNLYPISLLTEEKDYLLIPKERHKSGHVILNHPGVESQDKSLFMYTGKIDFVYPFLCRMLKNKEARAIQNKTRRFRMA
jgi:hypothetical protein